jgi:hypothetical protein
MHSYRLSRLLLLAFSLALIIQYAGWHISIWFLPLGLPGFLVSYFFEGPHGGIRWQTIAWTCASVAVNTYVYSLVLPVLWRRFSREDSPPSIL